MDVRKGEYSYFKVRIRNPYLYQELFTLVKEDEQPKYRKEVKRVKDLKEAVLLGHYDEGDYQEYKAQCEEKVFHSKGRIMI